LIAGSDVKRVLLNTLALAGAQLSWAATDFQYYVFPVQSITGLNSSATTTAESGPKYSGMINAQYTDLLFDAATQQSLLNGFRDEVRTHFAQAVVGANQIASVRSGAESIIKCNTQPVRYRDGQALRTTDG